MIERNTPNRKDLEHLAREIQQDQAKTNPAEKRVKLNMSFEKAIKKITQSPPPKKEAK
jgi:hypothetical protein